jgi:hypothetical protein
MEPRARKSAPHYHHPSSRQDWRTKLNWNQASRRYRRDFMLKHYQNLLPPSISIKSEIEEVFLPEASPPLLSAFFPFSHTLGEEPNSRKHQVREKRPEQVPEWYDEDVKELPSSKTENKEKVPEVQNSAGKEHVLKDLEEKFTQVDLKVEEKLKKQELEEDNEIPDWDEPDKEEFKFEQIKPVKETQSKQQIPIFNEELLRYHFAIGNPFSQTLMNFAVPCGTSKVTFEPNSKPFEKIWYYKDLEGKIHGPFSTLDMFCWTIRDCFPIDLQISIGGPGFFVPMNLFNDVNPQAIDTSFYARQDGKFNGKKNERKAEGKPSKRISK